MKQLQALVLAVILLFPTLASAGAKNEIQVLAISSNDAFENAQGLTVALKRAIARSERFSLAHGDFSLEVLSALFNCQEPPEPQCLAKIGKKVDSERFIWGTLEPSGANVVAKLHLWENDQERGQTKLEYSAALTEASDDTLIGLAAAAFERLIGSVESKLVVLARTIDGEIYVNGARAGQLSGGRAELKVTSGVLRVELRAPGFRPAREKVEIGIGETAELTLDPRPDDTGDFEAVPRGESNRKGHGQRIAGYGAIGIGSVLAGAGAFFWVQTVQQRSDETWRTYRATVSEDEDPCVRAEIDGRTDIVNHCDANKRARTAARIMVPSGLLIAGLGTVLLATDKSNSGEKISLGRARKTSRLELRPVFGPKGGRLDVRMKF